MPITALPTPPNRNSPTTFADDGDEFLGALPTFATEANTLETNVNAKEASATASALAAAGSATAAGAIAWVAATSYVVGNARYSPIDGQTYRCISATSDSTDPSANPTKWVRVNLTPTAVYMSARTSGTILGTADRGYLIDITSGTFTQTFAAAATLTPGWFCWIRNSGTGVITLDPNASELIDGASTQTVRPGACRLVQCTGTAFTSIVIPAYVAASTSGNVLTSNGSDWTSAAIPQDTASGVGSYAFLSAVATGAIAAGGTAAGSSLQAISIDGSGTASPGAYQTGTWKAMTGCANNYTTLFYRIA